MDFLGFWIYCSPLNSAQNDTKFASIPFFSGYLPFFALNYQTIHSYAIQRLINLSEKGSQFVHDSSVHQVEIASVAYLNI